MRPVVVRWFRRDLRAAAHESLAAATATEPTGPLVVLDPAALARAGGRRRTVLMEGVGCHTVLPVQRPAIPPWASRDRTPTIETNR
jgi:hypothetical protein